jgi:RAP1 GTPase activating protein 1
MWHVPALMPYFPGDEQQLERKKHVGNDRAIVIFQEEGGAPFPADIVASKAVHLCIVVQPFHKEGDETIHYRVGCAYKQSVPFFEPHIPQMVEYRRGATFREILLNKRKLSLTPALTGASPHPFQ